MSGEMAEGRRKSGLKDKNFSQWEMEKENNNGFSGIGKGTKAHSWSPSLTSGVLGE